MSENLKEKIKKAPKSPGIYSFKNQKGEIIYVGKASNLKNRLQSYLHKSSSQNPYKKRLFQELDDVSWEKTNNEVEALIAESKKIKKLTPKYNILMRDDKNYFYINTTNDQFPKIKITHQPPKDRRTIGPFTSGNALKESLKTLRKIFPYCSCKSIHESPCTNYYLELDPGYCCSKEIKDEVDKTKKEMIKEYKKNIKSIIDVLTGKKQGVVDKIRSEMKDEAEKKNFERAKVLRDQLKSLQSVLEHKRVISKNLIKDTLWKKLDLKKAPKRIEGYDVSNLQGNNATASLVSYTRSKETDLGLEASSYRKNKKKYRHFKIKTIKQANDPAMLKEVLERRAKHEDWGMPELIIADGGKTQLAAFNQAKAETKLEAGIIAFAKQNNIIYTEKGRQINFEKLAQPLQLLLKEIMEEAHRFAINYHRKIRNKM